MYTSAIEIGESNVNEIIAAAIFLKMEKVIEFGIKFLTKSLTVSNALAVYSTGKSHANTDLLNDVIKFISNNLEGVSATKGKSKTFLELKFDPNLKFDPTLKCDSIS